MFSQGNEIIQASEPELIMHQEVFKNEAELPRSADESAYVEECYE